jgi:hypothetical protein
MTAPLTPTSLNDMLDTLARWLPGLTLSNDNILWSPKNNNLYETLTSADIRRGLVLIFGRDEYIVYAHEAYARFMQLVCEDTFSFDIRRKEIFECVSCSTTGRLFENRLNKNGYFETLSDAYPIDLRTDMIIVGSFDSSMVYVNTCRHLGFNQKLADRFEIKNVRVSHIFVNLALLMFASIEIEDIHAIIIAYGAEYPVTTETDPWNNIHMYIPYNTRTNQPCLP